MTGVQTCALPIYTPKKRIKKIASKTTGFIYLVSLFGVTGAREELSQGLAKTIKKIKSITKKPVLVGFGISKPKHIKKLISLGANGAIVGSAYTNILSKYKHSAFSKLTRLSKLLKNPPS